MYQPRHSLTLHILMTYCPLWTCCPTGRIHPGTHGSSMSPSSNTQLTFRSFTALSPGSSFHQVVISTSAIIQHNLLAGRSSRELKDVTETRLLLPVLLLMTTNAFGEDVRVLLNDVTHTISVRKYA